jgi:arginase
LGRMQAGDSSCISRHLAEGRGVRARTRDLAILAAPSVLGLRPTGVERMAEALSSAGLVDRLGARTAGEVSVPPYDSRRDPVTGMLNPPGIAEFTHRLADEVGRLLDEGAFPIVLGGDCSILLGNLLALRRRGRSGLLFLDGHADFYQPEANVNGEAASSELAFATGRGPDPLTRFDGFCPLVGDEDVVVYGYRDAAEAAGYGSQALPASIRAYDLDAVRRLGPAATARAAVEHLARPELEGFWIHFDVDVLDAAIMPAVDYPLPDGMAWKEMEETLGAALSSDRAMGMDVTIFNPELDADGRLARSLVDLLGRSF